MPKTKISEYSATANSNTDVASINIDEGCAPSGINNAIRAVMGHLKDFQQGTNGDPFNGPVNGTVGATTPSTGAFTTLSATGDLSFSTVGSKVNFATTSSATVNYVGGSADGYSIEMVMQRGASQPLKYKQDYGVGHVWSIAGSDKMTLDTSGNLLVGTTGLGTIGSSSGSTITASGAIYSASTGESIFSRRSSDGDVILFRRDTTGVGNINVTTTATTFNSLSDYRLKNITGALTGAKDFIMSLQPKQGTWKTDGSKFVGFLAHEFQEVSPSSVTGEKDAVDADGKPIMQSMQASSSEVMANLVAFMQEQQALITQLTARITALEGA